MDMAGSLGPPPALPRVGWPSTTGPVLAITGGHSPFLPFFSFSLFFLSSSSSASSSSHFFFTATVARSAGEGQSDPTGCCPDADGGHCSRLGPGVPTGMPSGLNQHMGAGLALVRRRAARPSLRRSGRPMRHVRRSGLGTATARLGRGLAEAHPRPPPPFLLSLTLSLSLIGGGRTYLVAVAVVPATKGGEATEGRQRRGAQINEGANRASSMAVREGFSPPRAHVRPRGQLAPPQWLGGVRRRTGRKSRQEGGGPITKPGGVGEGREEGGGVERRKAADGLGGRASVVEEKETEKNRERERES